MRMPDWLDPNAPTIARILQQAGYRTGHFGKWHLTNSFIEGAPLPDAYGFDEFGVFNGGAGWPKSGIADTASDTVGFIKESQGKPFFVNVWIHETHTPHVPSTESMKRFEHLNEQQQVYAAVVADGDNQVGLILDALKKMNLEDNTIVIFSSDNGPEFTAKSRAKKDYKGRYDTYYSVGETGGLRGQKRSMFEGGVRTPFVVRWPGHAPAGIKNEITALAAIDLDLVPYDKKLVQGHEISFERASSLCDMLKSKTKQQRETISSLQVNRADVIVLGAIIMLEFMKASKSESIIVSESDNQEGYLAMKLNLL